MKITKAPLEGLLIMDPRVFEDARGYFFESFRSDVLAEFGFTESFVQDNESRSGKNVVRGLHLQAPPHAQDKLLRVVQGAILDVVVDVRRSSPTFGRSFQIELNATNKRSLLVPKGFAHGFCCLEDDTILQYKCTAYYDRGSEMGIKWNDPALGIDWPVTTEDAIVSERDVHHPQLSDFETPF